MSDESKEVAKYDRAMLEGGELQPVTTHDGHVIYVDSRGLFTATLEDVVVSEKTLDAAKEKVHSTHLIQERRRKKKVLAVPAFIFSEGGEKPFVGRGFFRGIHAGNGAVQWSQPDGTKGHHEGAFVLHPDNPEIAVLEEANRRKREAEKIIRACNEIIRPIRDRALLAMCGGKPGRTYGRVRLPYVHNNAAKAQVIADQVADVLSGAPDTREKE